MVTILFRTITIYIILVGVMKLTGKRQIGEMELSELVTTLLLSELAVSPITDNNIPLAHAIVPIVILITLEILSTFLIIKSNTIKGILRSRPSFIVKKGLLDQKELKKIRLSLNEFIEELRLKDIGDIRDVNYAILESNGRLAVFPKCEAPDKGIAHALIVDGQISKNNLMIIGQTEVWLLKKVANHKCDLKEVLLYTLDDSGNEFFIKKEN